MNKLVGVVGMCGSGKSRVTDFLKEKKWADFYFGGVTLAEVRKRGLEITPENERIVRESLREEFGAAAYAVLLTPKIKEQLNISNVVLDGLYSWDEYRYLKEQFGDRLVILCIVTNRTIRYERLETRTVRPLSFEEAKNRDYAEIEKLAKGGPIAIADYYITNNGTEQELVDSLEMVLEQL